MAQRVVLSRQEYLERQIREAFGPENRWFAGEKLGHSPDDNEAIEHYCEKGGASHFSEVYVPEDALAAS